METNQVGLGAYLKFLETRMGQLAQSLSENPPKSFPSNIEKNPKQCMVVTLRSGENMDEPKKVEKDEKQVEEKNLEFEERIEVEKDKAGVELNSKGKKKKYDEVVPVRMTFPDNPPMHTPTLPFSQRFQKTKLEKQFAQFLNMFKKLEINISFADVLAQMSNYVKFMKKIISNKKKLHPYGTVNLSENCSAIIQWKLL